MKRRMELEALGEELRVLYVALTRAKEKLILTASSRKWRIGLRSGAQWQPNTGRFRIRF